MLRLHAGLTQAELGRRLRSGSRRRGANNRVSDWELGWHVPNLITLKRYADLFGMTVAELLDGVM